MASHYRDAAKCLKAVDGGRTTLKTATDRLHWRLVRTGGLHASERRALVDTVATGAARRRPWHIIGG